MKAFVELSIAPSIRMGTQNLLAVSWLGRGGGGRGYGTMRL